MIVGLSPEARDAMGNPHRHSSGGVVHRVRFHHHGDRKARTWCGIALSGEDNCGYSHAAVDRGYRLPECRACGEARAAAQAELDEYLAGLDAPWAANRGGETQESH